MRAHLIIIGERNALAWVLTARRMAFPNYRLREAATLRRGDDLFLYTTRGCFGNPNRDRGRIIGIAEATSEVKPLEPAMELAGRSFGIGCSLSLKTLAPYGKGVELAPLVDELDAFPNKTGWFTRIRRPLVPLPEHDVAMLRQLLCSVAGKPQVVVDDYVAMARARVA